ncbi:unnamed protein product [Mytilus edulis]|uniref:Uncharacterized protein n=1 Tax=Mytilus edulis TaxID=6550 RepID=A0A8S3U1N7_MYTED|nr:unnamed protein product [Mytilus edulis]
MKGVYNLRPTKSKNICVWDVSLVLNYLRKLSPVNMLTLQEVTLKLVMLIALTNATRVQTLKFLSVDCMEKLRDEFVFHLDVLLKQSRPGYKNPDVKLRAFPPDRRLCVYTVLKEYIKRTEILRVHTKQLLISYIKPHKAVTCSTISRWIKVVLQKSGIDTRQFSAHSVRSAATSKAKLILKLTRRCSVCMAKGGAELSSFSSTTRQQMTSPIQSSLVVSIKKGDACSQTQCLQNLLSRLPYQKNQLFGLSINAVEAAIYSVELTDDSVKLCSYNDYIFRKFGKSFCVDSFSEFVIDIGLILYSSTQ